MLCFHLAEAWAWTAHLLLACVFLTVFFHIVTKRQRKLVSSLCMLAVAAMLVSFVVRALESRWAESCIPDRPVPSQKVVL